jgi:hypothetical protein
VDCITLAAAVVVAALAGLEFGLDEISPLFDETAGLTALELKLELFTNLFETGLEGTVATVTLGETRGEVKLDGVLPLYLPFSLALVFIFARFGLLVPGPALRCPVDRPFGTASCHPSSDACSSAKSS